MTEAALTLRITLVSPPAGVAYSLQKDDWPVDNQLSDGGDLTFEVPVRFVEDAKGARYLGPFVKNQGGRRFVYFRVGTSAGQHDSPWSRRGKIWLDDIPLDLARAGGVVAASFPGTGKDGTPTCATVRPIGGWRAV